MPASRRDVAERLVEDLEAEVHLLVGGRQRRCDPECLAQLTQLHDVHVQAELEAAGRDRRAELGRALLGRAIENELERPVLACETDVVWRVYSPISWERSARKSAAGRALGLLLRRARAPTVRPATTAPTEPCPPWRGVDLGRRR